MVTETLSTTDKELELIASQCLELGKSYTHCVRDGRIYEGNFGRPVMDLLRLTERLSNLGTPFEKYNITSGLCPHCYEEKINHNH